MSARVQPVGSAFLGETRILFADLDGGAIARGKYDFDVTGHYGRPDVFTLRVNRERQRSIS